MTMGAGRRDSPMTMGGEPDEGKPGRRPAQPLDMESDGAFEGFGCLTPSPKVPTAAAVQDSTEPGSELGSAFLSCMSPSAFPEDENVAESDDLDDDFGCCASAAPPDLDARRAWNDSETQTPESAVARRLDFISLEDNNRDPFDDELVIPSPATSSTVRWQDIEGRLPGLAGRQRPEDVDFWELTQGKPPQIIPDPAQRGVTVKQLKAILQFVHRRCDEDGCISGWYDPKTGRPLHYSSLNWQHAAHWIFRPMLKLAPAQCSLAEVLNVAGGPLAPKWVASYWTGEPLVDFVKRIEAHAAAVECMGGPTTPHHAADSYWVCPFATNLCEIARFSVSDAQRPGISKLRSLSELSLFFAGRPQKPPFGGLDLCLAACPALDWLQLDFTACAGIQRTDGLGRGLWPLRSLTTLGLNLSGCSRLTSLEDLAKGIAMLDVLQTLTINMSGCTSLSSVAGIGKALMPLMSLQTLCLDLSGCRELQDVSDLGKGLSFLQDLCVLRVDLSRCDALASVDDLARSLAELPCLDHLDLNISGCAGISSGEELGRGLVAALGLSKLTLDVTGCPPGVTDNARLREASAMLGARAANIDGASELLVFAGLHESGFSTPQGKNATPPWDLAPRTISRGLDSARTLMTNGAQRAPPLPLGMFSHRMVLDEGRIEEVPLSPSRPRQEESMKSTERTQQGWLML